ncbi:hypothetical protein MMC18_008300 [Xylographa bjoerkii]|nr:hypothetical protein [Xylographa bjoerkii]
MADCHNKIHHSDSDIHGGVHTTNGDTEVMHSSMKKDLPNVGAANISFYTPVQDPVAGTAVQSQSSEQIPKVFQPLRIRGVTFHNRIFVSPMCQYSADDGHHTLWHMAHLGGIIIRGPGLTIIEATAISSEGRITPEDSGLWKDSQIAPLARICNFAHSQGKDRQFAPWIDRKGAATENVGGWPEAVVSVSNQPYSETIHVPKEMTLDDIEGLKVSWVAAVKRAVLTGFDVVEIHAAHGYLLHSFLSSATNDRNNKYGGSLDNRIRLLLEIVDLTRADIPDSMPLFVRIPATDWMEYDTSVEAWTLEEAIALSMALAATGKVDFLDVSSGGLVATQKIISGPSYQAPFAAAISTAIKGSGVTVGTVGMLTSRKQAEKLLQRGYADVAIVARGFLMNPGLVQTWAEELGIEARVANQFGWGVGQRTGTGIKTMKLSGTAREDLVLDNK